MRDNPRFSDPLPLPERDPSQPPGLLFVLSGPSGVGKDTVIARLKREHLSIHFAITMTTRARRCNEVDGVNYYFTSVERFCDLERSGDLLEWAIVHGNHYGTPLAQVRDAITGGKDVLLKIDVQGAAKVKQRAPEGIFIFLAPPSLEELIGRLETRATESVDERARRILDAYDEMRHLPAYDYVVVNREGQVADAVERIKCIITAERSKVNPRRLKL